MIKESFFYNNELYVIAFDKIKLSDSINIDKSSFIQNKISTFLEMQAVLERIAFKVFIEDKMVFDSAEQNVNNLKFDITKKIYTILKPHLYLNVLEINEFLDSCNLFLKEKKPTMPLPEELFIAQHLFNGTIKLSLSDLMAMETKKYEKIQLAINLLEQAVGDIGSQN
jgi:hypothetical protein